jgi:hypothetical protein
MADPRNPHDQVSVHNFVVAMLVSGILDGTYETIDDAQIALECSRQALSKRLWKFNAELVAANDDFEPSC